MLAPIWLPTAAAEATSDVHLIIPDPRWEMPALLEPGRKPVGGVVVDNSTYRHVLYNTTTHGFTDLVQGSPSVTGAADLSITTGTQGKAIQFDANIVSYLDYPAANTGKHSHTYVAVIEADTDGRRTFLATSGVNAGSRVQLGKGGYNRILTLTLGSVAEYSSTIALDLNTPYAVGIAYNADLNTVDFAVYNLLTRTLETMFGVSTSASWIAGDGNFRVGGCHASAPYNWSGKIYQGVIIQDYLPPSQLVSYVKDSYQFLLPA